MDKGQLQVSTPVGGFHDDAPVAYQEVDGQRVPVEVRYALEGSTYGFRLGAYDPALPLVIDPALLLYCGFIGGSDNDYGTSVALDAVGNVYVTGYTLSGEATFPADVGPDTTFNGEIDAFVAKVRADGTGLLYAGYIGGSDDDKGFGIAVDAAGSAYIAGQTYSDDFPAAVGPDLTHGGGSDGFVAKVNAGGTGLVYAGYIGGSHGENGYGVAVDAAGSAYVTGYTNSTEETFPDGDGFGQLPGPDTTYGGGNQDAFVAKVLADGTGLVYTGYIGGSGSDNGLGIATDGLGSAYVVGHTESDDFPVVGGPDTSFNGEEDAFVTRIVVELAGVALSGPPVAVVGGAANFTAIVTPTAATRPVTYAWQATGQAPITQTAGLSDTAAFAWTIAGTQMVTVTTVNLCGVEVSAACTITVAAGWRVYLPLVVN